MNRWATEDPNPTEKVAEEKRIEEEGQKAISGMLDENLVEAAQTLRTLEDGDVEDFYPIEPSRPSPSPEPEPPAKRIRNGGAARLEQDGDEVPKHKATVHGGGGLLSEDAMDNLRYYAEMTRKQAEERGKKVVTSTATRPGIATLLGGYGSGDESD